MGEGIHSIGKGVRTDRSYLRDTDKGLNKQEAYTINKLEGKIRDRKTEKGYIVGPDGKVIAESIKGDRDSARFDSRDLVRAKDCVLTHNHPYVGKKGGLYDTLAGRVGVPFSDTDLINAVAHNLKEIRAVTPTYTYSIRRPKGGWGEPRAIAAELQQYGRNIVRTGAKYRAQQTDNILNVAKDIAKKKGMSGMSEALAYSDKRAKEISDRTNVGIQYGELKKLAKNLGWEFTRRKVK